MTNPANKKLIIAFGFVFVLLVPIIYFLNQRITRDIGERVQPKVRVQASSTSKGWESQADRLPGPGSPGANTQKESSDQSRTSSGLDSKQDIIHEPPLKDVILVQ